MREGGGSCNHAFVRAPFHATDLPCVELLAVAVENEDFSEEPGYATAAGLESSRDARCCDYDRQRRENHGYAF